MPSDRGSRVVIVGPRTADILAVIHLDPCSPLHTPHLRSFNGQPTARRIYREAEQNIWPVANEIAALGNHLPQTPCMRRQIARVGRHDFSAAHQHGPVPGLPTRLAALLESVRGNRSGLTAGRGFLKCVSERSLKSEFLPELTVL